MPYFAAAGYECHALSLRGHGASPVRRLRWASIDDYVADVAAVVDGLPAPPVLVGHSMGGLVVQRYLEGRRLPGAALLASDPVGGVWRVTLRVARRHPLRFLAANLTMRLWPLVSTPELARELFFSTTLPPAVVARHHAALQDESYRAYLQMLLTRFPRPKRVDTPMLVMGGADDFIFSPGEVARTAAAYGTEPVMIPGLAHDMMLDTNWERAADALRGWLGTVG